MAQAWTASLEVYIPQEVEAQVKPLCKMSKVLAQKLWNFSAVLAYVGHLQIQWNKNGNYPTTQNLGPPVPWLLSQP